MRVSFPIALGKKNIRLLKGREQKVHCHYLRDWSGTEVPAYLIFPPIDQMTAAAYIRQQGHTVQLLDGNAQHATETRLAREVFDFKPDWVILSSGWESLGQDLLFAQQIKDLHPTCRIAISGPNVTWNPQVAFENGNPIDAVILGELEGGLRGILHDDLSDNCAYRDAAQNVIRGKRTLIDDLDDLPFPARDLLKNSNYNLPFARRNPVTSVIASRGCPHGKCSFCIGNLFSMNTVRHRSADNVLGELEEIRTIYRIPEFMFRDQCWGADRSIATAILEGMVQRQLGLTWRASTRVNLVDQPFLELMQKAGCHSISFGFESPSQDVLDKNNKGITVEQSRQAARWAKQAGMEVSGGFLIALKGDRSDAHRKLLRFAIELGVDFPQFNITTVFPSTELYDQAAQSEQTDSGYGPGCPFNVNSADQKVVRKKLRWLYLRFYLRPSYLVQRLRKVRSFADALRLFRIGWGVLIYPLLYGRKA